MTQTVHIGAWICYFMWMLGVGWLGCERASDWGTERWGNQVRAMLLIGSAVGWIFFWLYLGNSILGVKKMPSNDAYLAAVVLGLICGPIGYVIYRKYISPRSPNNEKSKIETNAVLPPHLAEKKLTLMQWLVLDFGVIKKIRKARKDKKNAGK